MVEIARLGDTQGYLLNNALAELDAIEDVPYDQTIREHKALEARYQDAAKVIEAVSEALAPHEYTCPENAACRHFVADAQKALDGFFAVVDDDPLNDPAADVPQGAGLGDQLRANPKHRCHSCKKITRDSTAGCDHCDLEDK